MTDLTPKLGESLVRTLIQDLDVRVTALNKAQESGRIGPRTARARQRWLRQDYDRLCGIARRYGFKV